MELRQVSLSHAEEKGSLISILIKQALSFYRKVNHLIHSLFLVIKSALQVGKLKLNRDNSTYKPGEARDRQLRGKVSKNLKYLIYLIVTVVVLFAGTSLIKKVKVGELSSGKVEIKKAKATQVINREFLLPLTDDGGNEVDKIKYIIEKAEIRDEILWQGQTARAVKGRTFLILTLKIVNNYSEGVTINTKDYIRLSVNGNEDEWFAADSHNDPVEVQAISTEPVILGFAINESDKDLVIRVGEVGGEKEKIELKLQ